jgi:hypothetical protein
MTVFIGVINGRIMQMRKRKESCRLKSRLMKGKLYGRSTASWFVYCGIECETDCLGMRPLVGPLYLYWMMNEQVTLDYDKWYDKIECLPSVCPTSVSSTSNSFTNNIN